MGSDPTKPENLQELKKFYEKEIFPKLSETSEAKPVVDSYIPQSLAGRYLQNEYLAKNPYPLGQKDQLEKAQDGSDYSKLHGLYHKRFKRLTELFGYYDIYLIDGKTEEIFYNVSKDFDLGTNLKTGNYADSNIGELFRQVTKSRDPNFVKEVDFEIYRPSVNKPASFIGTTVFDGSEFLGVLIVQVSTEKVNQNMTTNRQWREIGLGTTGESFLVGQDRLIRSDPRMFLENPDQYFDSLKKAGYSQATTNKIHQAGSPILYQEVKTHTAEKALQGKSETELSVDYRGKSILSSYQPVNLGGFRWGLITKMDEEEAFKPIRDLGRRTLISAAILLPLVALLSSWLSGLFTRPIGRLLAATKRIAARDLDVQVDVNSKDELGELGRSFNEMSRTLKEKEQNLQLKVQENEDLLLNVLPPAAVKQFQDGDRSFADVYGDVTLIYAEIEGFSDLVSKTDVSQSLQKLNELIGAFDEAAEHYGIEKLKTVGTAYIAVCGLSIPRVDHAKRSVDFAIAMIKIIQTFSASHASHVTLDIGIHSGGIVGGIIGKSKFIYELWGDTMKVVHAIHSSPEEDVIQVTQPVLQALDKVYRFKSVPSVFVKGLGEIPVWELDLSSSATTTNPDREGVLA